MLVSDARIRRIDALTNGSISTYAINAASGLIGDGGAPTSAGGRPAGPVFRTSDAAYFASQSSTTVLVRKVAGSPAVVTTVLGQLDAVGDGPAVSGELSTPHALLTLAANQWLIADGYRGRLRIYDEVAERTRSVVGYRLGAPNASPLGQNARWTELLDNPFAMAYDAARSRLLVAEEASGGIRLIAVGADPATWTIDRANTSFAQGYADGSLATALFDHPSGLAMDVQRDCVWVADTENHVIRRIDLTSNTVSTVGGQVHYRGYVGDEGPVSLAFFDAPRGIAVSPLDHSLYIADTGNNRVRRVAVNAAGDLDGTSIIRNVFGDGSESTSGSGAPARAYAAGGALGLAFDGYGDLLVTTTSSVRVIAPGDDGVVDGDDAVVTIYGAAPRDGFPESVTGCLTGLAARPGDASIYVLDACVGYLVRLDRRTKSN
ncbi:MAG: hypothetical protein H7Z43_08100 [Clostridia bacterium]|nr:hypothetical protein [Deltaproteobacteria bacterium]